MANVKIRDGALIPALTGTEVLEIDNLTAVDYKVTLDQVADYAATTKTYTLSTTAQKIVDSINELYTLITTTENLWDRTDLGGGVYAVTPHTATDLINVPTATASSLIGVDSNKNLVTITELPTGTTVATTPSENDNTTKVATTAYVDRAVGNKTLFSYLELTEAAAPANPASGYSRLYIDADGLTSYKVNHGGSVTTPITLTAAGVPTFAGLTTNNGILTVNSSGTVSASVTLPDGTLATTQSAGDSSTKLATTAFVANALLWNRTAAGAGFYHVSPINDGTDIVKVTVHGNPATANYNYISEQTINSVSMTGVGNGILFKQYYYDGVTPATADEGYIGFFTEGNWTSTAATRNSSAKIRPVKAGVLVEGLTISSDGIPTFAGLTTDGGILQSSSAGLISSSTTVAKAIAFTLGLSTSGGVLLNEHAVDEPSTGQIMISASIAGDLNIGLKHASTLVNVKFSAAGVPTFPGLNVAGGVVTTDTNGVLSSSVTAALPTGTTATTQAANDNSTKLATTAYVDGKTSFAAGLTLGGALIIPLANRLIIGPDTTDGSFSFVVSGGHLFAQKYGTGQWGNAGQVQILA